MEIVGVTVTFGGAGPDCDVRDIPERKRMQARLMGASQLASIGTLAAGIAHGSVSPWRPCSLTCSSLPMS